MPVSQSLMVARKEVDSSLFHCYGAPDVQEGMRFCLYWSLDLYEITWVNGVPLFWCWK